MALPKPLNGRFLPDLKPKKLSLAGSAAKSGFETAIPVTKKGPYFQVKALNSSGKVIGKSKIVKLGS